MQIILILIGLAAVAVALKVMISTSTSSTNGTNSVQKAKPGSSSGSGRLTDQQIIALSSASLEKPIYGENPSFLSSQMPDDGLAFNQRTIDSLVRRGYLKSDEKGGYLLTPEGVYGLRKSMGF